jgi:hypothetical protein
VLGSDPTSAGSPTSVALLGVTGIVGYRSDAFTLLSTRYQSTSVSLAPSFDVFVAERWTLGGTFQATHTTTRGDGDPRTYGGWGFGATPRVGYVVPLAAGVAFWPRVGAGYTTSRIDTGDSGRTLTQTRSVGLTAGLVFALGRYALLDVGPEARFVAWSINTPQPGEADGDASTVEIGTRVSLSLFL